MNTPKLTERFEQALVYATCLHANQTRKVSHTPYIAHLMSVAALVLEAGGNEDEAISFDAALFSPFILFKSR